MLSFSISCPDLIKSQYFADTTETRWQGAKAEEIGGKTEGDFTDNSNVYLCSPPSLKTAVQASWSIWSAKR
jgi:hypothetical protein